MCAKVSKKRQKTRENVFICMCVRAGVRKSERKRMERGLFLVYFVSYYLMASACIKCRDARDAPEEKQQPDTRSEEQQRPTKKDQNEEKNRKKTTNDTSFHDFISPFIWRQTKFSFYWSHCFFFFFVFVIFLI